MYIIDTHALLWYLRDSAELSDMVHKIIDNEERIFTSIASFWEIAIKHSIGKLDLEFSISQIENLCIEKDITILPIKSMHLDILANLPKIHSDPFDRLIICQAITEKLMIITRDTIIPQYNVTTIW
jgi:PIN domain nuclease of toxin-antitoxin system